MTYTEEQIADAVDEGYERGLADGRDQGEENGYEIGYSDALADVHSALVELSENGGEDYLVVVEDLIANR